MSPHLHDAVERLVDVYLESNNEDACWLEGGFGREWHGAYLRLLSHTCRQMQRSMDWREFNELRPEIVAIVRRKVWRKGGAD